MVPSLVVHRLIPNHYTFYNAIEAVLPRLHFEARGIVLRREDRSVRGDSIQRTTKFLVSRWNFEFHLVLEEFVPLRWLVFIAVLSLVRPRFSFSLCVHNANSWLQFPVVRGTRGLLRVIARSLVVAAADSLIVVAKDLREYVAALAPHKLVHFVPFRVPPEHIRQDVRPATPQLCIPGNVEEQRRDYVTVLTAFRDMLATGTRAQLLLLGRFDASLLSKRLLDLVDEIDQSFPNAIIRFNQFVDDAEFDRLVCQSSALICNVHAFFETNRNVEIYGITKETGIRVLAECFGKACFVSRLIVPPRGTDYEVYDGVPDLTVKLANFCVNAR